MYLDFWAVEGFESHLSFSSPPPLFFDRIWPSGDTCRAGALACASSSFTTWCASGHTVTIWSLQKGRLIVTVRSFSTQTMSKVTRKSQIKRRRKGDTHVAKIKSTKSWNLKEGVYLRKSTFHLSGSTSPMVVEESKPTRFENHHKNVSTGRRHTLWARPMQCYSSNARLWGYRNMSLKDERGVNGPRSCQQSTTASPTHDKIHAQPKVHTKWLAKFYRSNETVYSSLAILASDTHGVKVGFRWIRQYR